MINLETIKMTAGEWDEFDPGYKKPGKLAILLNRFQAWRSARKNNKPRAYDDLVVQYEFFRDKIYNPFNVPYLVELVNSALNEIQYRFELFKNRYLLFFEIEFDICSGIW